MDRAAPTSLAQALTAARALGVDRLDAQLLLVQVLGRPRSWILAHDDEMLASADAAAFVALAWRRAAGEPLAYLTGEREFHGLQLRVSPDVLVPRPDTETLVEWALSLLAGPLAARAAPAIVDLGTGSGAVALAVQHAVPAAQVTATDLSAPALAVARGNGERLGIGVEWLQGTWWAPLAGRRFDLALSNPPYIAADDPHLAALAHEPQSALTPGSDGLSALRAVIHSAPAHLTPGGWLLLEHGHEQAEAVARQLGEAGFEQVATHRDLAGQPRCTGGRWPGAATDPIPADTGASAGP